MTLGVENDTGFAPLIPKRFFPKADNKGKRCLFYDADQESGEPGICNYPKAEIFGATCFVHGMIGPGCYVLDRNFGDKHRIPGSGMTEKSAGRGNFILAVALPAL